MKTNNLGDQKNFKAVAQKNFNEKRAIKEQYKEKNKDKWLIVGRNLRLERRKLGVTLSQIGTLLGTSPSRISKLENGKGVLLADHLIACYKLALILIRTKKQEVKPNNKIIDYIHIFDNGKNLYTVNLITKSGKSIHIRDNMNREGLIEYGFQLMKSLRKPLVIGENRKEGILIEDLSNR
ncbi:hypothetical protein C2I17_17410 [Niallia circulans]|uniref:helix-turn-helix domain-containing protein n=1 Tax=Niallia circulans TaxID=1397 RepID=UPI00201D6760|nr:helix-turn-helix transcriptional regulator [Niallia circulans]UQZ76192.1 hypothetical protein C2I17_17410 [Niallia circulans]